ncbi:MAG TPA: hypothetical protein DEW46_11055 [Verrucomicrobia bacterium]|jgi:2-dehydro-3-deoxy-D-arabinonate dehydratase|nr:hypothetical protein [Verrucomicrobiota bacterium]
MRICRYNTPDGRIRLGLWARLSEPDGQLGPRLIYPYRNDWTGAELLQATLPPSELLEAATEAPLPEDTRPLLPILDETPVWAMGVNYFRSCMIRSMRSPFKACYDHAFNADMPPLFLKGAGVFACRDGDTVPLPGGGIRVWPGPTLGWIFNARLELLGFCLANDMLIPGMESENPLRLGMSRVFHGHLGLGSALKLAEREGMGPWKIKARVRRGEANVAQGETNTEKMRWEVEHIRPFLEAWGPFPNGVVVLTGTEAVFEEDFTLEPGDQIRIRARGLGGFDQVVGERACPAVKA